MTTAPSTAMSKAEYLALAEQKYNDLQALATQPTFYDYEKSFEAIWMELGRQVLECTFGHGRRGEDRGSVRLVIRN